jgi:hypothetical protein
LSHRSRTSNQHSAAGDASASESAQLKRAKVGSSEGAMSTIWSGFLRWIPLGPTKDSAAAGSSPEGQSQLSDGPLSIGNMPDDSRGQDDRIPIRDDSSSIVPESSDPLSCEVTALVKLTIEQFPCVVQAGIR